MTPDAHILRALRSAGSSGVSGADLSTQLGISRAAIWSRIEDLRRVGFDIQASPHGGYQLKNSPEVLLADDLLARLGQTRVIGRDIRIFQQTTSTNDVAEKLGRDGVKEGVVIFAESQTKGRGRLGRSWLSLNSRGLWFSILLRPPLPPQAATQLTIASGAAVARALRRSTGLPAQIKWPNDILVNGRKVCGILTELSAELESIKHLVLGIGLNVNFTREEFPAELRPIATSVRIEMGKEASRAELAVALLRELDEDYQRVIGGRFPEVAEEWEENCGTLGQEVEIMVGRRVLRGRAESLDADGALLLRTSHGLLERVVGGDVTIKKN